MNSSGYNGTHFVFPAVESAVPTSAPTTHSTNRLPPGAIGTLPPDKYPHFPLKLAQINRDIDTSAPGSHQRKLAEARKKYYDLRVLLFNTVNKIIVHAPDSFSDAATNLSSMADFHTLYSTYQKFFSAHHQIADLNGGINLDFVDEGRLDVDDSSYADKDKGKGDAELCGFVTAMGSNLEELAAVIDGNLFVDPNGDHALVARTLKLQQECRFLYLL